MGRFEILHSHLVDEKMADHWRAVFRRCVVLRASYHISSQTVEYVAISTQFREIVADRVLERDLPEYSWTVEGPHHPNERRRFRAYAQEEK